MTLEVALPAAGDDDDVCCVITVAPAGWAGVVYVVYVVFSIALLVDSNILGHTTVTITTTVLHVNLSNTPSHTTHSPLEYY